MDQTEILLNDPLRTSAVPSVLTDFMDKVYFEIQQFLKMRVVRGPQRPILSTPVVMNMMVSQQQNVTKKVENYLIYLGEVLGHGNFSHVYKGINTLTNQMVAVKVIDLASMRTAALKDLLKSEIEILKIVQHQNCLRCLDIFTSNNNCYIVTELCNEGDLESKVIRNRGAMEEPMCKKFICDIYQGLLYLSELNIVHRDIKVANIFIRDGVAKIADFGFAKQTTQAFKDINVGSPIYMSPEGLLQSVYGPKTDVWAFGVLLFQMLHGDPPLAFCQTELELKMHISRPIDQRSFKLSVPQDLKDLIIKCLDVDWRRRISMRDIQFHPYITRILRELGRTLNSVRRQSRFSTTQQNFKNSVQSRSNSLSNLDTRNRLGQNRSDVISQSKYKGQAETLTITNMVSSTHPGQTSPANMVNSKYLSPLANTNNFGNNSRSKMSLTTGGSGITTTTSSSEFGVLNFEEGLQMLHYCRLIYKSVCLIHKLNRAQLLKLADYYINWLFEVLQDLQQRTPNQGSERQIKLKGVLNEYYSRYGKEFIRNPQVAVKLETIQQVNGQLLAFLDKKLNDQPESDHLDMAQLGVYICILADTTEVLRQCRERGEFSWILKTKGRLENCMSGNNSITVSSYNGVRAALNPNILKVGGNWGCI